MTTWTPEADDPRWHEPVPLDTRALVRLMDHARAAIAARPDRNFLASCLEVGDTSFRMAEEVGPPRRVVAVVIVGGRAVVRVPALDLVPPDDLL